MAPLSKSPAHSSVKVAVENVTRWPAVYLGETGGRVNVVARITVDNGVDAAATLVRQLTGNMDETPAIDTFCLGVCRGH